eukprot:364064_1
MLTAQVICVVLLSFTALVEAIITTPNIVNLTGQYFIADEIGSFIGQQVLCNSSTSDCYVICQYNNSCQQTNIHCISGECNIQCSAFRSCMKSIINVVSHNTLVQCTVDHSCYNSTMQFITTANEIDTSLNINCINDKSCYYVSLMSRMYNQISIVCGKKNEDIRACQHMSIDNNGMTNNMQSTVSCHSRWSCNSISYNASGQELLSHAHLFCGGISHADGTCSGVKFYCNLDNEHCSVLCATANRYSCYSGNQLYCYNCGNISCTIDGTVNYFSYAIPTTNPATCSTFIPTFSPTYTPTHTPTYDPSTSPTRNPSKTPTHTPSKTPTQFPSPAPTFNPTTTPTKNPTLPPTYNPSQTPTQIPSKTPSQDPTTTPTHDPSKTPTTSPTYMPTTSPTVTTNCEVIALNISVQSRNNSLYYLIQSNIPKFTNIVKENVINYFRQNKGMINYKFRSLVHKQNDSLMISFDVTNCDFD